MFTYTPLQAVTPTENLDTNIRAKGLAAGGFFSGCMGFINQFAGPIALANIGYRERKFRVVHRVRLKARVNSVHLGIRRLGYH